MDYKKYFPLLTDEAVKRAEHYQKQMHEFIENTIKESPETTYQSAANTFLLIKIGELDAGLSIAFRQ